jgi:hypothetical protein
MRRLLLPGVIAAALAFSPSASLAQQGRPYSLDDVKILIQGGLPAASILQRVKQNCLLFTLDDPAVAELRAAGATAELIDGLRPVCVRLPQAAAPPAPRVDSVPTAVVAAPPPAPAARQVFSPAGEAVRSLFVPGLGQFHTHRPAVGAAFLVGGIGALALGMLSQRVEVNCLSPMENGACPAGQVRDQATKRPMLVPGLAGFVGLGVISAFEAASGARRANAAPAGASGSPAGSHLEWVPDVMDAGGGRADVALLRLRF